MLSKLWRNYGTDKFDHGFLPFYDEILFPIKDNIKKIIEIWVYNWASIRMWRDYFWEESKVLWVDINPAMDIPWATVIRFDATTKEFADIVWNFDLIIDDWSHKSWDQINSFNLLWEKLTPGWIYILEDTHTSFMPSYINTTVTAYDFLREFSDKYCETKYKEFRRNGRESWTLVLFKNK